MDFFGSLITALSWWHFVYLMLGVLASVLVGGGKRPSHVWMLLAAVLVFALIFVYFGWEDISRQVAKAPTFGWSLGLGFAVSIVGLLLPLALRWRD